MTCSVKLVRETVTGRVYHEGRKTQTGRLRFVTSLFFLLFLQLHFIFALCLLLEVRNK